MCKKTRLFFAVVFLLFLPSAYAGKVELTTYYPAPYGEYSELSTHKMTVGSAYQGTVLGLEDGVLKISNKLAINIDPQPGNSLSVNGPALILNPGDTSHFLKLWPHEPALMVPNGKTLRFGHVTDSSNAAIFVENMRITPLGLISIGGNDNPQAKLDISVGSATGQGGIKLGWEPECTGLNEGTLRVDGVSGNKQLQFCRGNGSGGYNWVRVDNP